MFRTILLAASRFSHVPQLPVLSASTVADVWGSRNRLPCCALLSTHPVISHSSSAGLSSREFATAAVKSSSNKHHKVGKDAAVKSEEKKILRVAVLGLPNAGKSQLTNKLVGTKVSAVSNKVNTTRIPHLGAFVIEGSRTQVVLHDTPGLVSRRRYKDQQHGKRVASAWATACDCDLLLFIVDTPLQIKRNLSAVEDVAKQLAQRSAAAHAVPQPHSMASSQHTMPCTAATADDEGHSTQLHSTAHDSTADTGHSMHDSSAAPRQHNGAIAITMAADNGATVAPLSAIPPTAQPTWPSAAVPMEHSDQPSNPTIEMNFAGVLRDKEQHEAGSVMDGGGQAPTLQRQIDDNNNNGLQLDGVDAARVVGDHSAMASLSVNSASTAHTNAAIASATAATISATADAIMADHAHGELSSATDAILSATAIAAATDTTSAATGAIAAAMNADAPAATMAGHVAMPPAILVLNKMDVIPTSDDNKVTAVTQRLQQLHAFDRVFKISALHGTGLPQLLQYFSEKAKEGDWEFDINETTDKTPSELAVELMREQLFCNLHQELPYAVEPQHEHARNLTDGTLWLHMVLPVQKASQRPMVLGKKGATINAMVAAVQSQLQHALHRRVKLLVEVKVKPPK